MESWLLDTLKRVQEWDAKGEAKYLISMEHFKPDAVRVANLLRNNGYSVTIESDGFYKITISRKEIIHS